MMCQLEEEKGSQKYSKNFIRAIDVINNSQMFTLCETQSFTTIFGKSIQHRIVLTVES